MWLHIFDLLALLDRQYKWSLETFGPPSGNQAGVLDHIRKELIEIEEAPDDIEEWIDVMILAADGAMRCARATPEMVAAAWLAKQVKNEGRKWPDWRTSPPGKAICHIKETRVQDDYLPEGMSVEKRNKEYSICGS